MLCRLSFNSTIQFIYLQGDDEEAEGEGEKDEDEEEEDGFFVPHGYLSEDEGCDDNDDVSELGRVFATHYTIPLHTTHTTPQHSSPLIPHHTTHTTS